MTFLNEARLASRRRSAVTGDVRKAVLERIQFDMSDKPMAVKWMSLTAEIKLRIPVHNSLSKETRHCRTFWFVWLRSFWACSVCAPVLTTVGIEKNQNCGSRLNQPAFSWRRGLEAAADNPQRLLSPHENGRKRNISRYC
jgi:hypothetical protein